MLPNMDDSLVCRSFIAVSWDATVVGSAKVCVSSPIVSVVPLKDTLDPPPVEKKRKDSIMTNNIYCTNSMSSSPGASTLTFKTSHVSPPVPDTP